MNLKPIFSTFGLIALILSFGLEFPAQAVIVRLQETNTIKPTDAFLIQPLDGLLLKARRRRVVCQTRYVPGHRVGRYYVPGRYVQRCR